MKKVEDAWQLYKSVVLSSTSRKSQITEEGRWKNHIYPVMGNKPIKNLTKLDYYNLRQKIEKKRLSPQTVYHCLSLLRRVLNQVAEIDNSVYVPSFKSVMPKFDNRRLRYLTKKELYKILNALKRIEKSKNWHDIVLFAVNTGLRKSEIFNLKFEHISIYNKQLVVVNTKSHKNRMIPLNGIALKIIRRKNKGENSNIFIKKSPGVWKKALKESGLNDGINDSRQKVVFHSLRHTFASWLVQDGIPLALISQLLGHSSINVTMRYAHLAPDQGQIAVLKIAEKLSDL